MIVVLYHVTVLFPDPGIGGVLLTDTHPVIHSLAVLLFNGPAAVMVFFIVSGICIHAPYRNGRPVRLLEFYTRRYIRVGIPLVVACGFSAAIGSRCGASALPIWSLWCELAYYLIYPALILWMTRFGFRCIFLVAVGGAMLLSLFPDADNDRAWHYGPFLSWIVFLPVRLGGLWICDNANRSSLRVLRYGPTARGAVLAALALVALSSFITVLYHKVAGGLKYPLYLMFFFSVFAAIFVDFIVRVDLSRVRIIRFLERQGAWSYSLYLVHLPLVYLGTWILLRSGLAPLPPTGMVASAAAVFIASIALAIVFYHLVEKPSHLLAKRLGLAATRRFAAHLASARRGPDKAM